MNKYLILTKTLLINSFRPLSTSKTKMFAFGAIIIAALLPMLIGIGHYTSIMYDILSKINQEGILIAMGLSTTSMVIFFFGIFYIISVFYFSKDIETLLPLPLKPYQILSSKFTVTLIFEYLTEVIFMLPIIISYGLRSHAGFLYYLYSLIIFLTLPIIALVLASIVSMVVMRFTNIAKNKDRFRMVGGVIALFIAVFINGYFQKVAGENISPEQLQDLFLQGNNSLVALTSKFFPSIKYGALSIINYVNYTGLINLLIFLIMNILFLILFLFLGEILYFKGVIGLSEAPTRKAAKSGELEKSIVQKSAMYTYFLKELKILFRTPAFFMNCVLMNFIWPIFIIIPISLEPSVLDKLVIVGNFIMDETVLKIIIAGSFAFGILLTSTNGITATSISRDGQNLYISKYIPLSYKKQLMARILPGVFMGFVAVLMIYLIAMVLLRIPLFIILLSLTVCTLGIFLSSFIGIIIDLFSPKLVWDSEQKAVKQNLNVILNMLFSAAFAGLTVLVVFKLHLNVWVDFGVITVFYCIVNLYLLRYINTKGEELFAKIEV